MIINFNGTNFTVHFSTNNVFENPKPIYNSTILSYSNKYCWFDENCTECITRIQVNTTLSVHNTVIVTVTFVCNVRIIFENTEFLEIIHRQKWIKNNLKYKLKKYNRKKRTPNKVKQGELKKLIKSKLQPHAHFFLLYISTRYIGNLFSKTSACGCNLTTNNTYVSYSSGKLGDDRYCTVEVAVNVCMAAHPVPAVQKKDILHM